jgi:hypothetical protein
MTKTLETILILLLAVFSFCLGVKYSKSVREHAGWIFETNGDEVELPDLSDTQNPDMDIPVDENGKVIDQAVPPAEDQNIVPSIDESEPADQSASSQNQDNSPANKAAEPEKKAAPAPKKQQNIKK